MLLGMAPKEQLRYLLKRATSKEHAQKIAREFMIQQKVREAQKKKEVDPVTQAELMMKKLREAHHAVSFIVLSPIILCLMSKYRHTPLHRHT